MDTSAPIYDAETLDQLRELIDEGDTSFLDDLFQSYFETALENLQTLRTDSDQETLRRAAHTLKGSSLNVGATGVAGVCKSLEAELKVSVVEDMPARIALIEAQIERVRNSYESKIRELAGSS